MLGFVWVLEGGASFMLTLNDAHTCLLSIFFEGWAAAPTPPHLYYKDKQQRQEGKGEKGGIDAGKRVEVDGR